MSDLPADACPRYTEACSQLQPEAVDWLWLNRLAFATLAILDGDPGEGKSLLALDLCARLSTGRPMPDGSPGPGPCNTILIQSEDRFATTTLPRLLALGADRDRVFRWKPPPGTDEGFLLPSGLDRLKAELDRTQARLVIVDPLVDFLDPHISINSNQSIRRAFAPLRAVAEGYNCVVLMIRHLVKCILARALYRGGGSIGIAGVCRSCWLLGHDPENPDHRILAHLKNTNAPPQPSLVFAIQSTPGQPAVPIWLGESTLTAEGLLARSSNSPECDRAVAFLKSFLKDGPRLSSELWAAAKEQAFGEKTLRRAQTRLRIRFQRVRKPARATYWLLPGQPVPAQVSDEPDRFANLHAAIAEQVKKFPTSCPLDKAEDRHHDDLT
jgi:hypothetical protein